MSIKIKTFENFTCPKIYRFLNQNGYSTFSLEYLNEIKLKFKIACDVTKSVEFGKIYGFYDKQL